MNDRHLSGTAGIERRDDRLKLRIYLALVISEGNAASTARAPRDRSIKLGVQRSVGSVVMSKSMILGRLEQGCVFQNHTLDDN